MVSEDTIRGLVDAFFEGKDIFCVEVSISETNNNIEIYLDSDTFVTLDNCIAFSKYFEKQINREEEDYNLTVSSAGITSPFKNIRQYRKNIGNRVIITDNENKTANGILKELSKEGIILTKQVFSKAKKGVVPKVKSEEQYFYAFDNIKKARLFFEY